MEPSTTIQKMMANNRIVVPAYQRAYSWETPTDTSSRSTQTDVFLSDLEEYRASNTRSPYYFGHFLFEEAGQLFRVIDGQQRLTTLTLFLAALFTRLKSLRELTDPEHICFEDMIRRRSEIRFNTVDYDNQLFVDYVIDQSKTDHHGLETASAQRIVRAFDYFKVQLRDKSEDYLTEMLAIVCQAVCTTHPVRDESEAIQMFIFQNNRGKRPSNLEVVKAQFMYTVHLHGHDDDHKAQLIAEIKGRFENIYKSISSIEYRINEDDVLLYTLRVDFNSLWESNTLEKIGKMLASKEPIEFIQSFTRSLSASFLHLSDFFGKHEKEHFQIHSLVTLSGIAITLPFIIKAYRYALPITDIGALCSAFEGLIVRHRLIGTRADITARINGVYEAFTTKDSNITPILEHIDWLKNTDQSWWAYWNTEKLEEALQGEINHATAKHLLWKYEIHLERRGQRGYMPKRFDTIQSPELEHIAPRSEPTGMPHGYDEYDETFTSGYLNCLGNYLLLSKSHNCAVGNIVFSRKLATYAHNAQQREIATFVTNTQIWGKDAIQLRHDKIIEALMTEL